MSDLWMDFLMRMLIAAPAILVAITMHEFAHAWVAYKLGDYTAKAEGRLSLNPLVHLDPVGTIALFILRFGWAKPVPISEYNFKNPVRGMMLTAIAGPSANFFLAILGSLVFYFVNSDSYLVNHFIVFFVFINIALMTFNLIPIPPLDGHKIVRGLLPESIRYHWEQLEKYSLYIFLPTLIFLIYTRAIFIFVDLVVGNMIPGYRVFI
jgi:Zn-dependent protease